MSGHSKWAQIKHKKGLEDKKRGQIFSKIIRLITVAVKEKGPNPEANPSLKMAIEKAKSVNMPAENIERAIKKASGEETKGQALENIILEIYGPEGTAILTEGVTDNKKRMISEIKHILSQYDAKLAEEGSVKWLFDRIGIIKILKEKIKDIPDFELKIIDNGATDIKTENDTLIIYFKAEDFEKFKKLIADYQIEIDSLSLEWLPKNEISLTNPENIKKIENLLEALNNHNDITEIYSNIKMANE